MIGSSKYTLLSRRKNLRAAVSSSLKAQLAMRLLNRGKLSSPVLFALTLAYALVLHLDLALFSYLSALVCFALLVSKPRIGTLLLICTIILSPDRFVYVYDRNVNLIEDSVFLTQISGFTVISWLIVGCAILGLVQVLVRPMHVRRSVLVFLILPFAIPLHGAFHATDYRALISDLRYLVAPVSVFILLKASRIELSDLLRIFYFSLLVKCFTIVGITLVLCGFTVVFWGFVVYLIPLLLFFNLKRRFFWNAFVMVCVVCATLLFPGRGRILVLLYCMGMAFLYADWNYRLLLSMVVCILVVLLFWLFEGDYLLVRHLVFKLRTLNLIEPDATSLHLRLLEFQNIISGAMEKIYPLLIGEGYGGYYIDKYVPFDIKPLIGGSAYKDEWLFAGRYYDVHTNLNFMLLKSGMVCTALLFGGLLYFGILRRYKVRRELRLLILYLPVLGFEMVSIKLSLLYGCFIYFVDESLRFTGVLKRVAQTIERNSVTFPLRELACNPTSCKDFHGGC
jgi:hypothetical protein